MGNHRKRIAGALVAAGLAVTTIGAVSDSASADPPPDYAIDEEQLAEQITALELATGQEVLSGEIAGATWLAQVPDNWNGDLVIYAHGYAGEGTRLGVGPPPALGFLLDEGYAWAASSFNENPFSIVTRGLCIYIFSH